MSVTHLVFSIDPLKASWNLTQQTNQNDIIYCIACLNSSQLRNTAEKMCRFIFSHDLLHRTQEGFLSLPTAEETPSILSNAS